PAAELAAVPISAFTKGGGGRTRSNRALELHHLCGCCGCGGKCDHSGGGSGVCGAGSSSFGGGDRGGFGSRLGLSCNLGVSEGALPAAGLSALPLALGALPLALGALTAALGAPAAALGALAVAFGTPAAAPGALPMALDALAAALGAPTAAPGSLPTALSALAAALGAPAAALGAPTVALGAPAAALGTLASALGVLAAALGAPAAAPGALPTALCALAATPGPPPVALGVLVMAPGIGGAPSSADCTGRHTQCRLCQRSQHCCVGAGRGISFENGLKAGLGLSIQSDGVGGSSNVPCVSPSASTLGCSSPVLGFCPSSGSSSRAQAGWKPSFSWAVSRLAISLAQLGRELPSAFIPSSSVSPSMRIAAMRAGLLPGATATVWVLFALAGSVLAAEQPVLEYVFAQGDCERGAFVDTRTGAQLECAGGSCRCPHHVGVNLMASAAGGPALTSTSAGAQLTERLRTSARGFTFELWLRPAEGGAGAISLVALEPRDGTAAADGACGGGSNFRLTQREGELLIEVAAAYETAHGSLQCYRVAARAAGHPLAGHVSKLPTSKLLADPRSLYHIAFVAPSGEQARLYVTRVQPGSRLDARVTRELPLWLVEYALPVPFVIRPELSRWQAEQRFALGGRAPPAAAAGAGHRSTNAQASPEERAGAQLLYLAFYADPLSAADVSLRARAPLPRSVPVVADAEWEVAEDALTEMELLPLVHGGFDTTYFSNGAAKAGEGLRLLITALPDHGTLWDAGTAGAALLYSAEGGGAAAGSRGEESGAVRPRPLCAADLPYALDPPARVGFVGARNEHSAGASSYAHFGIAAVDPSGARSPRDGLVRVHVAPLNDPPVATSVALDVSTDAPVALRFEGTDVDGDAGELRAELLRLPRFGKLRLRLAPAASAADGAGAGPRLPEGLLDGAILTEADLHANHVPPLAVGGALVGANGVCVRGGGGGGGGGGADAAWESGREGRGSKGGCPECACVEYEFEPSAACPGVLDGRATLCNDSVSFTVRDALGGRSALPATVGLAVLSPLRALGGLSELAEGGSANLVLAAQARVPAGVAVEIEIVRAPERGILLRAQAAAAPAAAAADGRALRAGDRIPLGEALLYVPPARFFNRPAADPLDRPLAPGGVPSRAAGARSGGGEGEGECIEYRVILSDAPQPLGTATAATARSAVGRHALVVVNRPDAPTLVATGGTTLRARALAPTRLPLLVLGSEDGDAALVRVRARCERGFVSLAPRELGEGSVRFELGDGRSDGALAFTAVPSAAAALLARAEYTSTTAGPDVCTFEASPLLATADAAQRGGTREAAALPPAASRVELRVTVEPPARVGSAAAMAGERVRAQAVAALPLLVRGALCLALALCVLRCARRCTGRGGEERKQRAGGRAGGAAGGGGGGGGGGSDDRRGVAGGEDEADVEAPPPRGGLRPAKSSGSGASKPQPQPLFDTAAHALGRSVRARAYAQLHESDGDDGDDYGRGGGGLGPSAADERVVSLPPLPIWQVHSHARAAAAARAPRRTQAVGVGAGSARSSGSYSAGEAHSGVSSERAVSELSTERASERADERMERRFKARAAEAYSSRSSTDSWRSLSRS
ncbi:hypothetical protein T492DRAFT_876493, partial [Pavlovales sp. CCMP2436]